jgi:AhpD family alkylhydroperoxidase
MPERTVPHPALFRLVLIPLGLVQLVDGVWALFFPRSFYDDFPTGRGGWVSALPAYSEHLMTDVGALFVATGVLLIVAGLRLERGLVGVTLAVWLLWAVPHTVWHLFNLDAYGTGDAIANTLSLALTVLGPLGLLGLLARRPAGAPRAAAGDADGNARIRGVERPRNPLVRLAYRQTRRQFGHVVDPVKLTAHSAPLLLGYGAFEMATERVHRMDGRLKELAAMKAAQLAGCEWCLDFGSAAVRAAGVSDEDLRALLDYRASDVLSDDDKLVVEYAEAMSRTPVDVSDELFGRLRARFDEAQIVELTSAVALENYRARFNWALGIGSEGFSEGAYCVPPALAAASGPA